MDVFLFASLAQAVIENAKESGQTIAEYDKLAELGRRHEDKLAELERRTDRLALACQALWEILQERTKITEAEIFTRMEQIDLRDGRKGGKIRCQVVQCEGCGRNINSNRLVCIYCGRKRITQNIVY